MQIQGQWQETTYRDFEIMHIHSRDGIHGTHGDVLNRPRTVNHVLDPIDQNGHFTMRRIAQDGEMIIHGVFSQQHANHLQWILTDGVFANQVRQFTRV